MVPREPTRAGGRAAENPKRQAAGSLPILRTTDELSKYPEVLSGGLSNLEVVAQPAYSWRRADVGDILSDPTATPADASTDLAFLARCSESRLRNPLR